MLEVRWGEVAQSCPTLCDPVDCNLLGLSVPGILLARILAWIAISFSRGSSRPRDRTRASLIGGRRFNLWATRIEAYLKGEEAAFAVSSGSKFMLPLKLLKVVYSLITLYVYPTFQMVIFCQFLFLQETLISEMCLWHIVLEDKSPHSYA